MQATRGCTFPWILPYAGKIPWCPYWFKFILDASYHIYFYQDQPIIRHPSKTKAFVQPYLSYGIAIWGQAAPTNLEKILILQKRVLRLIHFKPLRFHAVSLFKLSNVLPLNFLCFKTICVIKHDVSNNVTPPNVSNLFTYSSKVHYHNTRFSVAGNFFIKHSRTEHIKNSISRIGAKIWNSIFRQWSCST